MVTVQPPEGAKRVAHGVSHGKAIRTGTKAPLGAKERFGMHRFSFAPSGALSIYFLYSHGSRHGLLSNAPPGLNDY